ncbi:MAG: dockerin type I domain-containing protein [bacterium]|nr:dockerin type I domain-containing protein [bacterium]
MALLFAASLLVGTLGGVSAQSLNWLGTLGGTRSVAYDVSDNGVVVGWSYNSGGWVRAFRYSSVTGMEDLGTLGWVSSVAYGVSGDGSVVVGAASYVPGYSYAFRWTRDNGMQSLGTLGGPWSRANAVSADGSVVVGEAATATAHHAFRWTELEGMRNLGVHPGGSPEATGVSADGSVVVGYSITDAGDYVAFLWTAPSRVEDIGTLGGRWSRANGVSADGSSVVGWATDIGGDVRAFRWTRDGGMQDLGTLGGSESVAYDVSADGSVVVGWAERAPGARQAFRWSASTGMQNLNHAFALLLTDGSVLFRAHTISPNGRYIAGEGYNATTQRLEAFLLDTYEELATGIYGSVFLSDFVGDVTQVPITICLRQGDAVIRSETVFKQPGRMFDFSFLLPPGVYDIAFEAPRWLRKVVLDVGVQAGFMTPVNVVLVNGDIDGDNEVSLFDFGALVSAFGTMPGDQDWNPYADLDGDGEVTLFDFGILTRSFGETGDDDWCDSGGN